LIQITVSSSGLPGASPRNGDKGKAAFLGRRNNKVSLLIPYHPGNFIHGHAAKLWSNPFGSLMISDDHTFLTRVIISGPCRIQKHNYIKVNFPEAAAAVADQKGRTGKPSPEPEYWFMQDVDKLIIERDPYQRIFFILVVKPALSARVGRLGMVRSQLTLLLKIFPFMIWIYSIKENWRDAKLTSPVFVTVTGKLLLLMP